MNIENINAVVTGGAGGIGAALCRALSDRGANVVVSDLNLAAAQQIADDINGTAIECDVSQETQIQELVKQSEAKLGHIDLFCSNAGFGVGEPGNVASAANEDMVMMVLRYR